MSDSWKKGNELKKTLLGEHWGTAAHKLRKMILFELVQKLGRDICVRCQKKIDSVEVLTIEHIKPWQQSETPIETFYDLENIGFSHSRCNIRHVHPSHPQLTLRKGTKEGEAWCWICKSSKDIIEFTKNKTRWNGVESECKVCRSKYRKERRASESNAAAPEGARG